VAGIEEGEVDLCLDDPGRDIELSICTDLRIEIFMGDLPLKLARSNDRVTKLGAADDGKAQ
jgi:hypothetical protein